MEHQSGELEKLLILAFKDSTDAEKGGKKEAEAYFETLINPESYTHDIRLKYVGDEKPGHGSSGQQLKYAYTEPEEMAFEFLFDNTGIVDNKPRASIADDIQKFKALLTDFNGDTHEPRHFKVVWGKNAIYKGRVVELSITYKLFSPDGQPLRAVAKVKFKSSIEDIKNAAKENKQSPDLTHIRQVKAGDTLTLMCQRIYGDPRYYLQVAAANGLGNFRNLIPGMELVFPPIDKKKHQLTIASHGRRHE